MGARNQTNLDAVSSIRQPDSVTRHAQPLRYAAFGAHQSGGHHATGARPTARPRAFPQAQSQRASHRFAQGRGDEHSKRNLALDRRNEFFHSQGRRVYQGVEMKFVFNAGANSALGPESDERFPLYRRISRSGFRFLQLEVRDALASNGSTAS